jgi:hypothetical protein
MPTDAVRDPGYSPGAAIVVYMIFAGILPATVGSHGGDGPGVALAALASFAAVAVVPLTWRLLAPAASVPLLVVALCSAGAAAIHFAVANEHFDEWWLFGVFFVGSGIAQLVWAVLALVRPVSWILLAGALGNAAIVALWVVTRTSGLPFGPEPGAAEAVGVADVAASVLEGLIVLGSLAVLAEPTRHTARRRAAAAIVVVGPAVVGVTTAALVSPAG